jgi:hypothetical protein
MWNPDGERRSVHWNWTAIVSFAGSLAFSLAAWRGVFWAVGHLVK